MRDYKNSGRRSRPHFDDSPKTGSDADLIRLLHSIDGASYGAYKRVRGEWDFASFKVHIDRIQADPYAPPSAVRLTASTSSMSLPPEALSTRDQRLATADFLVRSLRHHLRGEQRFNAISIAGTGQEILQRSAATVTAQEVELRIQVRLPARGRTVLGHQAANIFDLDLPALASATLDFSPGEYRDRLLSHVAAFEDHRALQQWLENSGNVAFVANQAILARRSGISELPMPDSIPFVAPPELTASVTLPHAGEVNGMAIPPGITLIVGGGYHGKSTLLSAIEKGVYAHVPGDGRELVAALPAAMKIRAADGRPVTKVDVSPFINDLPTGGDTRSFSTQNASGSTSQAATIVESLQAGSPLLLIDEDTSATNLMIRDSRMRALVAAAQEPITPLVDRIGALCAENQVSVLMVMGGSGAYLDVADRVLQMDRYRCLDVTDRARAVVAQMPRERSDLSSFPTLRPRSPRAWRPNTDRPKTRSTGLDRIDLDRQSIDISDVEQVVDPGQTEALGWALRAMLEHFADGHQSVAELADQVEETLERDGLDALSRFGARKYPAFLVRPRRVDIIAALNRFRALDVE